jgi:L-malate glycosyltransferase
MTNHAELIATADNQRPVPNQHPVVAPIRYLHIFPEYGRGGAELRISRTINAMGPHACHTILSINGRTSAATQLDSQGQTKVVVGPPKNGFLRYPFRLWSTIRQLNPSVILTYNWGATDAVLAARFARFRPVIHNECGLSVDRDGKGWRRRWLRRMLLPSCYRVVVTSKTLNDLALQQYGVPQSKLVYIKTGVDTTRFSPGHNQELRYRTSSGCQDSVVFGYIGSLRPSKNVAMILQAFARVHSATDRLAIFGDGPERQNLESLACDLGIRSAVYFHGYMDTPEEAFRAIDVNVTASRSEAASNSLLEAMASGLPVVSTDIADNKLLLSESNRPFVYSLDDLTNFAAGMKAMSSNLELRQRLGVINRERACGEYPVERMHREYIELWQQAAKAFKRG